MRQTLLVSIVAIALMSSVTAYAQDHNPMNHQMHMAAMTGDSRELVTFPPEMRAHTLSNMRDHLQALSEILMAMSSGQYNQAAKIADTRLGMDSPAAEGCKVANAAGSQPMPKPMNMDHQMSQFMPEGMRKVGLEMHQSASAFAAAAIKAGNTGNAKPALAALSKVTQQCAACHSAYKVQ